MLCSFLGYMPELQLENVGLAEAVAVADPSTLDYQTVTPEAPIVNGEPSNPPVSGISPIYPVYLLYLCFTTLKVFYVFNLKCGNDLLLFSDEIRQELRTVLESCLTR